MNDRPPPAPWPDPAAALSLKELSKSCRIPPEELEELVGYGALNPADPSLGAGKFGAEWIAPLREVARLRADFDLDLFTVALLLSYLRRIDALEREIHRLHAQHSPEVPPTHHEPQLWREGHGNAARDGR